MHAQYDGPDPKDMYSDIEGGLGWWRDTRFATETPKFIMGGVARNFSEWANGPGAGKGRDWQKPQGKYGIAQLSPWVLWPPDGLNLKQGTSGQLFGYGYLPLPLIPAKPTTLGAPVPTGDQSWTLFLNTANFRGPVAFFTPCFWSRAAIADPAVSGMFLDTRGSQPNKAVQMETQYIPAWQARDAQGQLFARVAPTAFPRNPDGTSTTVHRITAYDRKALWDDVVAWFSGGAPASGRIAWSDFAKPEAIDAETFGYRWDPNFTSQTGTDSQALVQLPEYYRLTTGDKGQPRWEPVAPAKVPAETQLQQVRFERVARPQTEPYVTPEEPDSCWKKPGPAAGPFQAFPGDGSVITWYWYRFADQPALQNADLTDEEREALQRRVELIHKTWTKDREYLPPPARGSVAELDPALLVTPPPGMEAGYVPIVTRQAQKEQQ
jgi:hypothetical protein